MSSVVPQRLKNLGIRWDETEPIQSSKPLSQWNSPRIFSFLAWNVVLLDNNVIKTDFI
jgi:hypothetical protein